VSFDYDQPDVPEVVAAAVVAEIKSHGTPPPPTPEEQEERWLASQAWREQCRQRDEQRRLEYEQEEAARAEQEKAEWLAEHRKAEAARQRERQEQFTRELHQRELRDMRFQLTQAKSRQRNVENATNQAVRQQYRQTLLGELDAMINPPQPEPEPEPQIIVVSDEGSPELGSPDFDVGAFNKKSRRWW
jgi:hypothetical protein